MAVVCDRLTADDADDSLDNNDIVSLNAESLSGLSVRDARDGPLESDPLPLPLSDDVEIDAVVTPDIIELERECVRRLWPFIICCWAITIALCPICILLSMGTTFAFTLVASFDVRCSNKLSSPRIASNSASCVSSKLAIEKRYVLVRSDDVWLWGLNRIGAALGISKPCVGEREKKNGTFSMKSDFHSLLCLLLSRLFENRNTKCKLHAGEQGKLWKTEGRSGETPLNKQNNKTCLIQPWIDNNCLFPYLDCIATT